MGKGEINIKIRDILYIETEWRNIVVHTSDNRIKCSGTLSEYEKQLKSVGFCRCHNSYLVNLDKIKNFVVVQYILLMMNLPISAREDIQKLKSSI